MKKREYLSPEMDVEIFTIRNNILTASNIPGGGEIPDDISNSAGYFGDGPEY